ncbi:putative F-box/LRR-repeat protein 9 [Arachis stenosperma]|uniref:putative F-box/LRR-repeat protein 9 n=1 Tax=Arachis stenosperma TaxID=217475 RepID=UPI0025AC24C8|nr:putative F-box/LRR-repeat protein 9 [Arachis stenosperma]
MARWTTNPLLRGHKRETAVRKCETAVRKRETAVPKCETAVINWLDLPNDLTLMIFSRLGTFDILNSVQQMCCHAIDRSCGQLEDISIQYFGNDCLLEYIIDSQCNLRRLRLVQCFYAIFDEGLCEIAQKLPLLEELEITLCKHVSYVALEAIGRGCPLLKSLKFNHNDCSRGNEDAFAIAQNMPNLRHLQLVRNDCMDDDGVSAILDGCRFLESLDIQPNTPEGFLGYKFRERYSTLWYDDFKYTFTPRKERLSYHIAENESQDNDKSSEEEEKEKVTTEEVITEKVTTDWDEIYDIWEYMVCLDIICWNAMSLSGYGEGALSKLD